MLCLQGSNVFFLKNVVPVKSAILMIQPIAASIMIPMCFKVIFTILMLKVGEIKHMTYLHIRILFLFYTVHKWTDNRVQLFW